MKNYFGSLKKLRKLLKRTIVNQFCTADSKIEEEEEQ